MPSQSMAVNVEPGLAVPARQDHACKGSPGPNRGPASGRRLELSSEAGPQDAAGEGDDAADGVHDSRPGEISEYHPTGVVHESPNQPIVLPSHCWTPHPVAEDRVDQARYEDAVEDVALEAGATDECARRPSTPYQRRQLERKKARNATDVDL